MRTAARILDAAFNRAREALRVIEDLARFQRDDRDAASSLKAVRHELDRLARPHRAEFLRARESAADVGRDGDRPVREARNLVDVAAANFKRAGEALRTIEEVAKGRLGEMSRTAHRLRFDLYTLEKEFESPRRRLDKARLYVLLDPDVARGPLDRIAREAVRGGADVLQLRQKPRVDPGLARALRAATRDSIFIVNDRADIALAVGADGVHVGAGDLSVSEARRLGVPIVGATTHSLAEARRAARAGADYVSVGPMFATERKPDLPPRGFDYLAGVKRLGVPFFCIGGITAANVRPAMVRVAVCGGVVAQENPAAAARAIRRRLTSGR
jgi:thiamine-phosphate pyrophosphorylase